ncbi:exocyst complex component EXO84C isoform X2 [Nymphaea colorata]|nr:exocyst complex component EXO84C isoform X2 [Nymphaea colorata]
MTGVCRELEVWKLNKPEPVEHKENNIHEFDSIPNCIGDPKAAFLESVDVLLAEHKMEEALLAIEEEEKNNPDLLDSGDNTSEEVSTYKSAFLKRKAMLVEQLIEVAERPSVGVLELKSALMRLLKLGNGPSAHNLLLKSYRSRLQKNIENFLPLCVIYPETNSATLSKYVFSTILSAARESSSIFGNTAIYTGRLEQWIECELESLVKLMKENAPSSESASALRAVAVCVKASLSHCAMLEEQGLAFSQLLFMLLRPYVDEILEMNFRRARKLVDQLANDEIVISSTRYLSSYSADACSMLTSSGKQFMSVVQDIVDHLTSDVILHFGGTILSRISQLFDMYIDGLMKSLPGLSEEDTLMEHKGSTKFKAETDSQQLALLGNAYAVLDELLPMALSKICSEEKELTGNESLSSESTGPIPSKAVELKDWRRHLQHSLDKFRDYFCRQYMLNFIYSRGDKAQLDARMYLHGKKEDLFWDSEPLPSLPFQDLFAKLQQLASIAGLILVGKEKVQKNLLARLVETLVMWLSDEQEFWEVFEDDSAQLRPFGLQQFIFDMHFIVQISVCGGYPSRNVHQIALTIMDRAIGTFSTKGIDPQSALPEDEWFIEAAKSAMNKLLMGSFELSELDEHIHILENSDSDNISISSSVHSAESFASATMEENGSPVYFSDPET